MSFFNELKRRNVFRVGIAYLVATWLLIQVTDIIFPRIGLPDSAVTLVIALLAIGFIPALIFAWAFEMTPEGLKKERDVDREQSITQHTGRKLDFIIIGILALAVVYLLADKFWLDDEMGSGSLPQVTENAVGGADNEKENQAPTQDNSIAVLPFANRSRLEDDLFFTDGIHDDLLTQLAKIDDLKVISRTSVMEYRDTTMKIPEIAAELGVGKILEGGVQRAGKRIRINAQLIDVSTDEHLWAETFDREMTVENIFDIQSEITRHIVEAVRGELTEEESELLSQMPTESLEAYEAYLHAKSLINLPDYNMEKYIAAEEWLLKALEHDPEFAMAWAILEQTQTQYIWIGIDASQERLDKVKEALANAEKYGPGLPETLAARADYLYRIESDYVSAERLFAAASAARPGDSLFLLERAMAARRIGQFDEAVEHLEEAFELDPANVSAPVLLAGTLVTSGQFERAEPLVDLWMRQFPDAVSFPAHKIVILLYQHGDVAGARELFDNLEPQEGNAYETATLAVLMADRDFQGYIDLYSRPPLSGLLEIPTYQLWVGHQISFAYGQMGDEDNARKHARLAIEAGSGLETIDVNTNAARLETMALAHAWLGEFETALDLVNQAYAIKNESTDSLEGPNVGITRANIMGRAGLRDEAVAEIERLLEVPGGLKRWSLHLDPWWDFFRDDPRFVALSTPINIEEKRR